LKTYTFPYGTTNQHLSLDEEHVLLYLDSPQAKAVRDEEEAIRKSLYKPVSGRPLRECVKTGGTVVIVVSDITRPVHTDRMLRILVGELNLMGVQDEQITVLIALGTHRQQTREETEAVCGADMVRRLYIVQHDCHDESQLLSVGVTSRGNQVRINRLAVEADTLIVTGGISFHDMAGFGGGRKAILPGIAGYDTIMANHALALSDDEADGMNHNCDAGKLQGNPIHEDMMEGAAFVPPHFLLNLVFTASGSLYDVVSGTWDTAWQKGCEKLLALDGVPIPTQADVVIGSAGGYPKDINMYQATKAHMNAVFAVKPGGIMILAMACEDMYEPASFADWFFRDDLSQVLTEVKQHFTIPAFSAYKTRCIIRQLKAVIIVTEPQYFHVIRKSGQIPALSMDEAWGIARGLLTEDGKEASYTVTVMPYAASTLPLYTGK
jgi:nickel-dependent lactate racemase